MQGRGVSKNEGLPFVASSQPRKDMYPSGVFTSDGGIDQTRVDSTQFFKSESHLGQFSGDIVLDEDVDLLDHIVDQGFTRFGSDIDCNRLLVPVHAQEVGTLMDRVFLVHSVDREGWTPRASVVSSFGVLDLDHLRTVVPRKKENSQQ